jgi:hypothetical protein
MITLRSQVLRSLQGFLHLLRVFINTHDSKDSERALQWQFTNKETFFSDVKSKDKRLTQTPLQR